MNVFYTTQFKKDYKRVRKQGKDLSVLEEVIRTLCRGEKLAPRHNPIGYLDAGTGTVSAIFALTGC